ncbi:MAG TPA: DMT family transporter [Ottowia sp.]|uniref:DMT family transporter n=1 Tax=Ottowia sp. TaxID=1898956 RepID=UPI002C00A2CA|nr:DMT family transporter [Ottowia sp.]HMN21670.1 DMT family transporter [Ottowia sp.]
MRTPSRAVGIVAAVVTVALWTGFIVIGRASAAHTLLPYDLALVRIGGAGLVLLPWSLWLTRPGRPLRAQASLGGLSPVPLRQTVATGLFGGLLYAVLCYAGFFFAPAAHASVLMPGSLPLWSALLALPLLGERLTPARVLGLACIAGGDLLVGGASLLAALDGGEVWKGDLIFVLAGFCWAMYGVLVRRFRLDPVHSTMAITALACVAYLPLYALLSSQGLIPTRLAQAPLAEILLQALFQGVGVVVIAGITFVIMVQVFGPVRSMMLTALVPGLSALGAVALLGEPLGWNLAAGLALVTLGILFGVRTGSPRAGAAAVPSGAAEQALPGAVRRRPS